MAALEGERPRQADFAGWLIGITRKTVVTALVVLLAAVLGSLVLFPGGGPDGPPTGFDDGMSPPPTVVNKKGGDETAPPVVDAAPPPVDLAAADRNLDLHGRVVDGQKRPVPGARVETIRWPWRRSSVLNQEGYDEPTPGPATRSATDGSFLLRLRRGALVDLRVTADGFADTTIPRCQAGERLLVVLTEGAEL